MASNLPKRLFLRLFRPQPSQLSSSKLCRGAKTQPFHAYAAQRAPQTLDTPRAHTRQGSQAKSTRPALLASAGGLVTLFTAALILPTSDRPDVSEEPGSQAADDGRDPDLPRYRLSDIRKHGRSSDEPWVTSGDKVYSIKEFLPAHPGGEIILNAAGGSIDPYWDIFTIHKSPHVYEILDQYLIGFIDASDLVDGKPAADKVKDPFENDPKRDPRLITHTPKPRNAETPNDELAKEFITPSELFFVRHHMWVPLVEDDAAKEHKLTIELPDGEERTYTLDELRTRFKPYRMTATLQCSGNRRNDMTEQVGKTNGLQWGVGAISNAEWEGVRLSDVLADAGLDTNPSTEDPDDEPPDSSKMHVQFSGLEAYGASIPLATALDPRGDVLLAYGMNGQPLPRDHGFPLRAVVPGHVAARSVKWLSRIAVADEESHTPWQRRDYKGFGPNEGAKPDWERYPAIQEMPITSAITSVHVGKGGKDDVKHPTPNVESHRAAPGVHDPSAWRAAHIPPATLQCGIPISVTGYAYSGGGRPIVRVDISVDGGRTWDQAELQANDRPRGSRRWAWTRWRYEGRLVAPKGKSDDDGGEGGERCAEVVVKATDDAYNTQPEHHAAVYNVRGNLATAWHRVRVCPRCPMTGKGVPSFGGAAEAMVSGCGFKKDGAGEKTGDGNGEEKKREKKKEVQIR
jgi:sulfite oxidase